MTSVIKTKMSSKKSTKVKDVNRPKKASTAYILFSNAMRETVKAQNPTMKSNEIMTELGRLWKQISDNDREKYQKMFELERTRYENEMTSYVPPAKEVPTKSKDKSDLKKPMNAYVIFSQEARTRVKEEEPSLTFGEVTQRLATKWNSMSDSEKEKYNNLSREQRDVYENAKKCMNTPTPATPPPATKSTVVPATPVKKAKRKPRVEEELVDDE